MKDSDIGEVPPVIDSLFAVTEKPKKVFVTDFTVTVNDLGVFYWPRTFQVNLDGEQAEDLQPSKEADLANNFAAGKYVRYADYLMLEKNFDMLKERIVELEKWLSRNRKRRARQAFEFENSVKHSLAVLISELVRYEE